MAELASIALHRTDRNAYDQAALDALGKVVYRFFHCSTCTETTDECDKQFKCSRSRVLMEHVQNCADEQNCTDECYVWRHVMIHVNACHVSPCDLCAYKYDEHPLVPEDTYDEEDEEDEEDKEDNDDNQD